MSITENKALAHRILEEVFSQGRLSQIEELFTPGILIHDPDKELLGFEQVKQGILRLREAFPDLTYSIEDMIGEDDKVMVRFTGKGTHRGNFRGVAPTDKQMTYTGIMIMRLAEGKLAEYWAVSDALGIFRQLGVYPSLPHSS